MIRAETANSWHNRGAVSVADLLPAVASWPSVAVVGANDPGSSRLVYALVIGLVLIGVALVVLGFWILRQTRVDLDALAPLERMGDGDWKRKDPSSQRRMLDEVRPEGARPLASEPAPPPLDVDFEQSDHPVTSFSDLGPGLGEGDSTPAHIAADFDQESPDPAEQNGRTD